MDPSTIVDYIVATFPNVNHVSKDDDWFFIYSPELTPAEQHRRLTFSRPACGARAVSASCSRGSPDLP
jgi:hypothetical protein